MTLCQPGRRDAPPHLRSAESRTSFCACWAAWPSRSTRPTPATAPWSANTPTSTLSPTRTAPRSCWTFLPEMGYTPNKTFNTLSGDRRQLWYDEEHGRQIDIFIGDFTMCHTLPLADRLEVEPLTIPLAELFLSKAQIVELNRKDVLDLLTLLLDHEVGPGDEETINTDLIAELCAKDWGLYTTVSTEHPEAARLSGRGQRRSGRGRGADDQEAPGGHPEGHGRGAQRPWPGRCGPGSARACAGTKKSKKCKGRETWCVVRSAWSKARTTHHAIRNPKSKEEDFRDDQPAFFRSAHGGQTRAGGHHLPGRRGQGPGQQAPHAGHRQGAGQRRPGGRGHQSPQGRQRGLCPVRRRGGQPAHRAGGQCRRAVQGRGLRRPDRLWRRQPHGHGQVDRRRRRPRRLDPRFRVGRPAADHQAHPAPGLRADHVGHRQRGDALGGHHRPGAQDQVQRRRHGADRRPRGAASTPG